jgi:hypothetical protein
VETHARRLAVALAFCRDRGKQRAQRLDPVGNNVPT